MKPIVISSEEAAEIRRRIDSEAEKETGSLDAAIESVSGKLAPLDEKLRKLTRCLIDEIIDEESYKAAKGGRPPREKPPQGRAEPPSEEQDQFMD